MGFTVTTVDPFALLHSMTLTFDANPLNPDIDSGSAWVTAFLFPTFFVFGEVWCVRKARAASSKYVEQTTTSLSIERCFSTS